MNGFLILFAVALVVSAIGFKKYVWFISIGYGFSVAAIGAALLCMFGGSADMMFDHRKALMSLMRSPVRQAKPNANWVSLTPLVSSDAMKS